MLKVIQTAEVEEEPVASANMQGDPVALEDKEMIQVPTLH
jgi:hypothetical protein